MAVTCHKILYFQAQGVVFDSDTTGDYDEGGLTPGLTYTPGHDSHMPWYDGSRFELSKITYNAVDGEDVTTGKITCPSSNFTCYYFFDLLPPADWAWISTVRKGESFDDVYKISSTEYEVSPLTASEWNEFVERVADFYRYTRANIDASKSRTWHVTRGTEMLAEEVEYMRTLIDAMNPPKAVPSAVTSGRRITAAYINGLKDSLNSIERD